MNMFVAAAVALALQSPVSSDPRSSDALALFDDMCVGTLIGQKSHVDPALFVMMKVDEKDARATLPEFDPRKVWGVLGKRSNVQMFIGNGPGLCMAEVMESDAESIRTGFEQLVQRTAKMLGSAAQIEKQNRNPANGGKATYQAWGLKSYRGDIMLALTASTTAGSEVQHLLTAGYVK